MCTDSRTNKWSNTKLYRFGSNVFLQSYELRLSLEFPAKFLKEGKRLKLMFTLSFASVDFQSMLTEGMYAGMLKMVLIPRRSDT